MEIKYNQPILVNKVQYDYLMNKYSGIIAGRYDNETNEYFIKVWIMSYSEQIKQFLNK